jgi:uncharacterized protein (TIGR00297 family)
VPSIVVALLLATIVACAAWRLSALTGGGTLAAIAVGTAILWGTGWAGGAALLVFFAGSSAVSRLTAHATPAWVDARGNERDAVQVFANGGMALLGGLWAGHDLVVGLAIVTGSLAAAAADTWATSFGGLSGSMPRLIHSGRPVPVGTSGGVSLPGTIGGIVGAVLVAGAAGLMVGSRELIWLGTAVGVAGMMADSLLGATLQGRFRCVPCQLPSERVTHRCGVRTEPVGGVAWIGNDAVNLLATMLAGGAGWFLASWLVAS